MPPLNEHQFGGHDAEFEEKFGDILKRSRERWDRASQWVSGNDIYKDPEYRQLLEEQDRPFKEAYRKEVQSHQRGVKALSRTTVSMKRFGRGVRSPKKVNLGRVARTAKARRIR